MARISEEVRNWNTPILGSYLLWRFSHGFANHHKFGESPIILYHFIASSILTSSRLIQPVSDKREGLASYVKSFNDKKDIDLLLSIQDRIEATKQYTLSALDLGIRQRLFVLDSEDARLYPREVKKKATKGRALNPEAKSLGKKAEILGKWFSKHELPQVASMLKVVL